MRNDKDAYTMLAKPIISKHSSDLALKKRNKSSDTLFNRSNFNGRVSPNFAHGE